MLNSSGNLRGWIKREERLSIWLLLACIGVCGKSINLSIFNEEEFLDQRLQEFFTKSPLEWSHASLEMESLFLDTLPCGQLGFFVGCSCICPLVVVF